MVVAWRFVNDILHLHDLLLGVMVLYREKYLLFMKENDTIKSFNVPSQMSILHVPFKLISPECAI